VLQLPEVQEFVAETRERHALMTTGRARRYQRGSLCSSENGEIWYGKYYPAPGAPQKRVQLGRISEMNEKQARRSISLQTPLEQRRTSGGKRPNGPLRLHGSLTPGVRKMAFASGKQISVELFVNRPNQGAREPGERLRPRGPVPSSLAGEDFV
jgi:hypothetical protein